MVNLLKNKDMDRQKNALSVLFLLFGILFCVGLVAANVFETKQIDLVWGSVTGGVLVFPVTYIINDCVTEVWGYGKARLLIWAGFAANFLFVGLGALVDALPGAQYWDNEAGFHAIFGLAPRIAAASFVAFIAGSFANSYVMSRMKIASKGGRFSVRAVASTLVGESIDSIIFFPLAFYGVIPTGELPKLMAWQVVLKTGYEIAVLPLTIWVVKKVKAHEGEDAYDRGRSYNILKIFDL